MPRLPMLAAALCLLALPLGCAKAPQEVAGDTPDATAKAFAEAMKKGDVKTAATAYAYVSEAKQKNESWAEIPTGQQNSIIRKLQDAKAQKLGEMTARFKDGAEVGTVQAQGANAFVSLKLKDGTMDLQMVQEDGKWRISGSE